MSDVNSMRNQKTITFTAPFVTLGNNTIPAGFSITTGATASSIVVGTETILLNSITACISIAPAVSEVLASDLAADVQAVADLATANTTIATRNATITAWHTYATANDAYVTALIAAVHAKADVLPTDSRPVKPV